VSHLQFADDTLILGEKSWANVRALRAVLNLFAEMSGLKVIFHKSLLVGINIGDSWLSEKSSILNCKVGKILFMYLGLSIGGDPRRLAFWEHVVSTIKARLVGWQSCFFIFRGPFSSSQVCLDLTSCLRPFLFQSFVRYNFSH